MSGVSVYVMFLGLGCVCMCTSACVVYVCARGRPGREGRRDRERERGRERAFNQTAAFTKLKCCGLTGPVQQAALKGQSMA